jgi:hypothetical protein
MRCREVSTMDESRNRVLTRANGNVRTRLYLGREEEAIGGYGEGGAAPF